jgi:hypothetical protein
MGYPLSPKNVFENIIIGRMNFLRNAKQVLDTAQTLSKEVSNAYAQHQQQQQTTETQSSSKSKCSDLKKEEQNVIIFHLEVYIYLFRMF